MAQDFEELPVYNGSGAYHFNRFRLAFDPSKIIDMRQKLAAESLRGLLVADFMANFTKYVKSDSAVVEWRADKTYQGAATLKFTGSIPIFKAHLKAPHHDWVGIAKQTRFGFTVQTLKYLFDDGSKLEPSINKSHFLAGRRAWRIDAGSAFGYPDNIWILETVAVERFSNWAFRIAGTVLGLEDAIKPVWTGLLNNYVARRPVTRWPKPLVLGPRWKPLNNVNVFYEEFDKLEELKSDSEFISALKLYPDILPPPPSDPSGFAGFGGGSSGGGGAGRAF